jgi:hypothetical protein
MKTKIGMVDVDAGMLMVGDPCYFIGKDASINDRCDSWDQACDEVFCKGDPTRDTPLDVYKLGIAIGTTNGVGSYPVYLETTAAGRRRLIINLD